MCAFLYIQQNVLGSASKNMGLSGTRIFLSLSLSAILQFPVILHNPECNIAIFPSTKWRNSLAVIRSMNNSILRAKHLKCAPKLLN